MRMRLKGLTKELFRLEVFIWCCQAALSREDRPSLGSSSDCFALAAGPRFSEPIGALPLVEGGNFVEGRVHGRDCQGQAGLASRSKCRIVRNVLE